MKLKDQVFDWLSGTYGQTVGQIVTCLEENERIRTSTEQIEAALADLLEENRVYTIEGGGETRYRCVLADPPWVEKAKAAIVEGLEDCWPGGMGFWVCPEDRNLGCCPSPFDVETEDGIERCFPDMQIDLTSLFKLFDSIKHLAYSSRNISVSFEGQIDGEDAWIVIEGEPPDSWESVGKMDREGGFELYE